ncbi:MULTISPECIES: DUF4419 domain-containing protein [unclassified Kitasatospora]|uniref:DUF4419 domain-containing protein n=1 Tax=unclassified Kitasatospora TaxID=2633591 RepID=UPI000710B862|nr:MULTISPECIES: DUF4419 domain-containing protein [unclassified Kitasatospora]KQV17180.1 hypothetical protein ASC99_26640 [Kitasatospora sp. Root107]KRB69971.1 hypothetical protein ASE03_25225 [Kitasatospora sp. Root187]
MAFEIYLPLTDDPEGDAKAARLAGELGEIGNERFLRAVLRDPAAFHHRSTDRLVGWVTATPGAVEPNSSLLLRALHLSFTAHLPLSLSPDLLWYAVVHEVAVHVRLNSVAYEGLFTDTPGFRQTITVYDDSAPSDWERSINLVQEPLRERIGTETAELFQPAFSTTTSADATAALVALMDVVSPYYRFRWKSLCGIPRIRLEGTAGDWDLLALRVRGLADRFEGLRPWFTALHPVLDEIAATAAGRGVEQEFWRSLYKYRSRSGGASVTGWINAFFAHRYTDDGPCPKEEFGPGSSSAGDFPSHVSRVPFRWQTLVGTFDMAVLGGVLGIERDEEWIRPRLGHAVVELLPADPRDDRLPEPWYLADIQRLTGSREARLLDTLGTVTHEGTLLQVDCGIDVEEGTCVVRTVEGDWYLGDLVSNAGDIVCWENCGPDLGVALRTL